MERYNCTKCGKVLKVIPEKCNCNTNNTKDKILQILREVFLLNTQKLEKQLELQQTIWMLHLL